jgi:hypothetical protein
MNWGKWTATQNSYKTNLCPVLKIICGWLSNFEVFRVGLFLMV